MIHESSSGDVNHHHQQQNPHPYAKNMEHVNEHSRNSLAEITKSHTILLRTSLFPTSVLARNMLTFSTSVSNSETLCLVDTRHESHYCHLAKPLHVPRVYILCLEALMVMGVVINSNCY